MPIFLLKLAWFGQAWPARSGLAGPGPTRPGLTASLSMWEGPTSTKIYFLLRNIVLGLFQSFWNLKIVLQKLTSGGLRVKIKAF